MNNVSANINTNVNTGVNVIGFSNGSISEVINGFLNRKSDNTKRTYKKNYNSLFMFLFATDINVVSKNQIQNITVSDAYRFQDYLDKIMKPNSVNQVIFSCKSLWDRFIKLEIVNKNVFIIESLTVKEHVHYGSLTENELYGLYDYCLSCERKPMTKKLYFEFLVTVICRKTIAQELTFDHIKHEVNWQDGNEYWVIKGFDKTDEVNRPITNEFYNRLKANFDSYDASDKAKGFVFNVSDQTLDKTLKDYCDYAGIDRVGRNIVQHSLKGTGSDTIQRTFGDINITACAAGHKSIQTTYNNYLNKNKDLSKQPSIVLNQDYDFEQLRGLSVDQLMYVIEDCNKDVLINIFLKAQKLGYVK